jgi:hypothetical protein
MTTYTVTFKNQVGIDGVYGTRSIGGTHTNVDDANAEAAYIAKFSDSAVAIVKAAA